MSGIAVTGNRQMGDKALSMGKYMITEERNKHKQLCC